MLGVRAVGTRQMPSLLLAVVGFVLIALLLVADATLNTVSTIVTSDRIGLPDGIPTRYKLSPPRQRPHLI